MISISNEASERLTSIAKSTVNLPRLQQLLQQASCFPKANSQLIQIEFKDKLDADEFSKELLKIAFCNRNMPNQTKKIESVWDDSNNNNDIKCYVIELTNAEWEAIQSNGQEVVYESTIAQSNNNNNAITSIQQQEALQIQAALFDAAEDSQQKKNDLVPRSP